MSVADGLKPSASGLPAGLRQPAENARATLATLFRPPRRRVTWPSLGQLVIGLVAASLIVMATIWLIDPWSIAHVRQLPGPLVEAFNRLTDFGKSGVFLWPLGMALVVLALLDTPAMPRIPRLVLSAWAVRLGFVFVAVALPGLFVTIVKRLIGRARPFVEGTDVLAFAPFGWKVDYASLPSGHTTTAFAALVAVGAIFPHARALMWIFAVSIALSRIVVTAHHPADVVAAALVGAGGAWLVRNWFAARGLGFAAGLDGTVRPMPGPSLRRIGKALAVRLSGV